MLTRRAVVAIPARDEADDIVSCLERISSLRLCPEVEEVGVFLFANNCRDDTADRASAVAKTAALCLTVETATLDPDRAHAGWARRLALEGAARSLRAPGDILLSTDADTWVAEDWLVRTVDHLNDGFDAVAGLARLKPLELRALTPLHRRRLAAIRRYEDARTHLEGLQPGSEPSPRHGYEGGASIALTFEAFESLGPLATPRVGEDRALFAALRAQGRRIRHAMDVRVLTSCRLNGRAPDGTADALSRWGMLDDDTCVGLSPLPPPFGSATADPLTWKTLETETRRARALFSDVRAGRARATAG